jgi:hypothetical protein
MDTEEHELKLDGEEILEHGCELHKWYKIIINILP